MESARMLLGSEKEKSPPFLLPVFPRAPPPFNKETSAEDRVLLCESKNREQFDLTLAF